MRVSPAEDAELLGLQVRTGCRPPFIFDEDLRALAFQLRVWCRVELTARIRSELGIAIHDALRGAGNEIPFPQTDVHLKVESSGPD